jgi:polysaccharide export outer membrane protein
VGRQRLVALVINKAMKMNARLCQIVWIALSLLITVPGFAAQPTPGMTAEEKKYVPYRIARGDRLAIAVFGEPDLTGGNRKVEATGTVALPLVGEIRLVGLTIVEAQAAVENAYRDQRFVRNPQVTVTIEESVPRWVSISGKINIPGKHEMPTDTTWTLKDLIIKAGGLQETARGSKVRITRILPNGQTVYFEKDVEGLLRAKNNASAVDGNFPLEPEDIVYVPEKII